MPVRRHPECLLQPNAAVEIFADQPRSPGASVFSKTTTSAADSATIRLRSKALVGGSIDIAANKRRRKRRLASGRRLRELTVPLFVWFLREAPRPLAKLPVAAFLGLVRLLCRVPSNPLRRATEDMSVICRAKGQDIKAVAIYEGLSDNTHVATELALRLYRDGLESVIDDVHISAADVTRIQNLVDQYGGVAVAVPQHSLSTLNGPAKMRRATAALPWSPGPSGSQAHDPFNHVLHEKTQHSESQHEEQNKGA